MGKNTNVRGVNFDQYFERNLRADAKHAANVRLFNEGVIWGFDGKRLEDATEIILFDNQASMKKDIPNFCRGYKKGVENRENYEKGMSFKDVNMSDIPVEFRNNSYFLRGYRDAIQLNNSTLEQGSYSKR